MFNSGNNGGPESMQLYITSDVNTTGKVEIEGIGFSKNISITANQITTVDIPRTAALTDQGLFNKGIHVTALKPVVVYSFIYVNAVSGATVCLPTNTLGRDYYSINFEQQSNEVNSHNYFFVIAADTGTTTVEVTPAAMTKAGQPANVPFFVKLTQGQVYQVLGSSESNLGVDLTGSRIRSVNDGSGCKRIAVFSGSGKISIGCSGPLSSDNLYQQVYPVTTWGRKYVTVNGAINANNYFRILKSDPVSVVKVNGRMVSSSSFVNDRYYDFLSSSTNVIESDKPILVAQYFTTQSCGGNPQPGDPEMIILNPVEQTIKEVTLNSMQPNSGTNINVHYLNVVLKNDPGAINSFKIDGLTYTSNFKPVPEDNNYAYARIATSRGTHNIKCDSGFNIIAYGLGDFESYGYSGGTNLKDLYQYASIKNEYAEVNFPATCVGSPFRISMTFPYKPTRYEYRYDGLLPDVSFEAPVPDSSFVLNGRTLYVYRNPALYTVDRIGTYPVRIIAYNPTADGCTGIQEIDYDLNVYNKPIADFNYEGSRCLDDIVELKNTSLTIDRPVTRWIWDLGNGSKVAEPEPKVEFTSPGKYNVTFNYINDIGCISSIATHAINIHPVPVANFSTKGPYCINGGIILSDQSTIQTGKINSWKWSMGDGIILEKNAPLDFNYKFSTAGSYKISLQAESDSACKSRVIEKEIFVHPKPQVGFIMPENCISDPFSKFVDSSSISDGSNQTFSYAWTFGDPGSGGANSSSLKDPLHKYNAIGNYNVKLKIVNAQNCTDSLSKIFTVNGSTPQSVFSIEGGNDHCSNDTIYLNNLSTVDFGSITKLEIYWDDLNDRNNKLVDEEPFEGKKYSKLYNRFFTPASMQYVIRMVAYSGESCLSVSSQTLNLRSIPELVFDPPVPVCGNFNAFQLTAAVTGNNDGEGIFSGKGTNASGIFNPSMVAAGEHNIRFTYYGGNGCRSFKEQPMVVYPVPNVDAGKDKFVLEGEAVQLSGSASGIESSYWEPIVIGSDSTPLAPFVSPLEDTYYKLTGVSTRGCIQTDNVFVKVLKIPVIPNVFSPNLDGIHDTWIIRYLDTYPGATIEVFNRYGQSVYNPGSYKPWDGNIKGKPAPVGTYYYLINPKNGRKLMKGFVDLIR